MFDVDFKKIKPKVCEFKKHFFNFDHTNLSQMQNLIQIPEKNQTL